MQSASREQTPPIPLGNTHTDVWQTSSSPMQGVIAQVSFHPAKDSPATQTPLSQRLESAQPVIIAAVTQVPPSGDGLRHTPGTSRS